MYVCGSLIRRGTLIARHTVGIVGYPVGDLHVGQPFGQRVLFFVHVEQFVRALVRSGHHVDFRYGRAESGHFLDTLGRVRDTHDAIAFHLRHKYVLIAVKTAQQQCVSAA